MSLPPILRSMPSYPDGQCSRFCADRWSVAPGPYWGDARFWLDSGHQAGYATSSVPEVGAIAVWGANMGGTRDAGHVALVQAIAPLTVAESNWNIPLQPDQRPVSAYSQTGIIGYVLPRKATEEPMNYTLAQQRAYIHQCAYESWLREISEEEMQHWLGVWNTQGQEGVVAGIFDTPEAVTVTQARRRLLGLP